MNETELVDVSAETNEETRRPESLGVARDTVRRRLRAALSRKEPEVSKVARLGALDLLLSLSIYEDVGSPRSACWVGQVHSTIVDLLSRKGAEESGELGDWRTLLEGLEAKDGGGSGKAGGESRKTKSPARAARPRFQPLYAAVVRDIVAAYESDDPMVGGSIAGTAAKVGVSKPSVRKFVRLHCIEGEPLPPVK